MRLPVEDGAFHRDRRCRATRAPRRAGVPRHLHRASARAGGSARASPAAPRATFVQASHPPRAGQERAVAALVEHTERNVMEAAARIVVGLAASAVGLWAGRPLTAPPTTRSAPRHGRSAAAGSRSTTRRTPARRAQGHVGGGAALPGRGRRHPAAAVPVRPDAGRFCPDPTSAAWWSCDPILCVTWPC